MVVIVNQPETEKVTALRDHLRRNPTPVIKTIEWAKENLGFSTYQTRKAIDSLIDSGEISVAVVKTEGRGRPSKVLGGKRE